MDLERRDSQTPKETALQPLVNENQYVPVQRGDFAAAEDCDLFFDLILDLEDAAEKIGLCLLSASLEAALDACLEERERLAAGNVMFRSIRTV